MKVGLYIHIPFRIYKHNHRCTHSFYNMDFYIKDYFKYLKKELLLLKNDDYTIDSIYFGGGDPSSVNSDYVEEIINLVQENFNIEENCEKTIEINAVCPDFRIKNYIRLGFNRFSIKIFTFDRKGIENLELFHDKNEVTSIVKMIRKLGVTNINADMYFSYPGQTLKMLKDDLKDLKSFDFPHVSYYSYYTDDNDNIYESKEEIDDLNELESDMLDEISNSLKSFGYNHYEISHFEKGGSRSEYAKRYWGLEPYVAAGLGSIGLIGNKLYKNELEFDNYFEKIRKGERPLLEIEELSNEDMAKNYIISNMGLSEGVNLSDVKKRFGYDIEKKHADLLNSLIKDGLIVKDGDNISFTEKGRFLSNQLYMGII